MSVILRELQVCSKLFLDVFIFIIIIMKFLSHHVVHDLGPTGATSTLTNKQLLLETCVCVCYDMLIGRLLRLNKTFAKY